MGLVVVVVVLLSLVFVLPVVVVVLPFSHLTTAWYTTDVFPQPPFTGHLNLVHVHLISLLPVFCSILLLCCFIIAPRFAVVL